jgi:16S rRNA (guanine527-N7)-methyltransferase
VSDLVAYLEAKTRRVTGRTLTPVEVDRLSKYLNLLIKWRRSQRLIGSGEPTWIVDKVIVDSLLFTRALPAGIGTLADVGSGAGIPGIPLAVVLADVEVTLIEARQKRASFLAAALRELSLGNCRLLNDRIEAVREHVSGRFNAVVMRCAGNPTALLPYLQDMVAPGGVVVASGPPERLELEVGDWLEVQGPDGIRRFWIYHVT